VNFYYHDAQLRDNPPVPQGAAITLGAPAANPYTWQRHVYDLSQPENLGFLQELRTLMDEYPGSTTVGEIGDDNPLQLMAQYTAGGDKLHMAYTFDLLNTPHSADYIREVVARFRDNAGDAWPCWALSNHDVVRSATRWGAGEDAAAYPRIALAMLMSLRGSVCLYQGEELGLPEAEVPFERIQDPYGIPFWPEFKGRDGCRTPMVWDHSEQGGFSTVEPWLPVDERHLGLSVDEQERQSDSMLHAMRVFIKWRQQQPALVKGELELVDGTGDILCWIRRDSAQTMLVALNLTGQTQRVAWRGPALSVLAGHGFNGEVDGDEIVLPAYQALFAQV